jgi:sortase A
MRAVLRALSTVLIVAGVLLMADAGLTLAWQEPVSALYAKVTQDRLDGELAELETVGPTAVEVAALRAIPDAPRRLRYLARSLKRRTDEGGAAGRIRIPEIGADFVVVDGTEPASLRKGPGFFPQNPLPGAGGTTAIAGHRTTYSAPFRRVDDLERGDEITVDMPYARFRYAVERTRIVEPTELGVLRRVGHDRLVLTACHPLYSAAQRIVVFARLVATEPTADGPVPIRAGARTRRAAAPGPGR